MIKPDFNFPLLKMIKKNKLIFFLMLILLNNCSFDNKTGLWKDSENEKRRISKLEKEQKQIIDTEEIYSSKNIFSKEVVLVRNITLSKPKKNSLWMVSNLNNQNYLGNIYLPNIDNIFLKKKMAKTNSLCQKLLLHY